MIPAKQGIEVNAKKLQRCCRCDSRFLGKFFVHGLFRGFAALNTPAGQVPAWHVGVADEHDGSEFILRDAAHAKRHASLQAPIQAEKWRQRTSHLAIKATFRWREKAIRDWRNERIGFPSGNAMLGARPLGARRGLRMALWLIGGFVVVFVILNIFDFGRID